MFSDYSDEPAGFTSTVTTEKAEATNIVQTEPIALASKETQNTTQRTVQTQAMEAKKPVTEVDYDKLAAFLKRITPSLLEALDETINSDVLDGYDPIVSREPAVQVKLLNKFCTLEEPSSNKKISALTWSTNGGTLAIAYSVLRHETWCDHLSAIKFYELTREDNLPQTASKNLETNACVTSLTYHPTKPAILAAGFYNGEVALWNLADDDSSIVPLLVCIHGDVVTTLMWRERTINEPHLLITSSADGYIFIHKLTTNFTTASLHIKYKIIKEHNPAENTRPRSSGGRRERAAEAGLSITCLDFSLKPSIFVVGTLCGGLYKCSLDSTIPVQGDDTLIDPVIDDYDRFDGSVTALKCSEISNLFVASGTNMEIRVYDIDQVNFSIKHSWSLDSFAEYRLFQSSPLRSITVEHTAVGLKWFPCGKEVISTYGADSCVHFYDITNSTRVANLKIESSCENTGCLDFNRKRDTAALADTHGNLEIWKIPKQTAL